MRRFEYVITDVEDLAALLHQDWRTYDAESEEIGQVLAEIHLGLCEQVPASPGALAERLVRLHPASQMGTSCIKVGGGAEVGNRAPRLVSQGAGHLSRRAGSPVRCARPRCHPPGPA